MKISFTKRLLLPVIFFVMGTSAAHAKAVPLLNKTLEFEGLSEGEVITSLEGYEGWTFENCTATQFNNKMLIKAGNSTTFGSITTPAITELRGNSRLILEAVSINGNDTLLIQNEKGTIIDKHLLKTANTRIKLSPTLFRDGNSSSRLKFTCIGSNNVRHPFMIANVYLLYMDNNPDFIFYESFNNVNGTGGNDNKYGYNQFYNLDNSYVNETQLKEYSLLDYPKNKVEYIYATNKCIFMGSKNSSIYEISKLQLNKTIYCKISFWLAGETTGPQNQSLNVLIDNNSVRNISTNNITDGGWNGYSIYSYLSPNSTITFNGGYVFLDDVMITEVSDSLKEDADNNSEKLDSYANKTINLSLKRTLREGIWNTLCLPFEFTTTSISGANIEMERLQSVDNGVFHFEPATTIPAGEPFILKTDQTIVDPKFHAVTITATEPGTVTPTAGYSFKGIYSPTALETDGTNIFLATDGLLYTPAEGKNTMNGLRAYMIVPSNSIQARMAHDPYGTSGIRQTLIPSRPATIYNLCGQAMGTSLKQLPQGIYIVNGKKVYTK